MCVSTPVSCIHMHVWGGGEGKERVSYLHPIEERPMKQGGAQTNTWRTPDDILAHFKEHRTMSKGKRLPLHQWKFWLSPQCGYYGDYQTRTTSATSLQAQNKHSPPRPLFNLLLLCLHLLPYSTSTSANPQLIPKCLVATHT